MNGSARGLSKIGAYMANNGTFNGKTIMSKQTCDLFHANPTTLTD